MGRKVEFRVGDVIVRVGGFAGVSATILDFDGLNYVIRWNWGGTSLLSHDESDHYIRIDDIVGGGR